MGSLKNFLRRVFIALWYAVLIGAFISMYFAKKSEDGIYVFFFGIGTIIAILLFFQYILLGVVNPEKLAEGLKNSKETQFVDFADPEMPIFDLNEAKALVKYYKEIGEDDVSIANRLLHRQDNIGKALRYCVSAGKDMKVVWGLIFEKY